MKKINHAHRHRSSVGSWFPNDRAIGESAGRTCPSPDIVIGPSPPGPGGGDAWSSSNQGDLDHRPCPPAPRHRSHETVAGGTGPPERPSGGMCTPTRIRPGRAVSLSDGSVFPLLVALGCLSGWSSILQLIERMIESKQTCSRNGSAPPPFLLACVLLARMVRSSTPRERTADMSRSRRPTPARGRDRRVPWSTAGLFWVRQPP